MFFRGVFFIYNIIEFILILWFKLFLIKYIKYICLDVSLIILILNFFLKICLKILKGLFLMNLFNFEIVFYICINW